MTDADDLIKAIRNDNLAEVKRLLDSGVPVELNDGNGAAGLPLGIACFMGHADIVSELVGRGAKVNLADNWEPVSPLAMATRGHRTDVVRLLIELGAEPPQGMETGLSEKEVTAAKWLAYQQGKRTAPPLNVSGEVPEIEEIIMSKPFGVDTSVLEADLMKQAREMEEKKNRR